ncbi:MAG: hypothetical protein CVV25_08490 [Ignavibacteriae bacterium HGW-Ignavibacteriae-4]|nr:MAG: hypothetical protein CVV25_08490 [Ignavibacteriae bacterium HGW-Ignavibacteriae-4]
MFWILTMNKRLLIIFFLKFLIISCGKEQTLPLKDLINNYTGSTPILSLDNLNLESQKSFFANSSDTITINVNTYIIPLFSNQLLVLKRNKIFLIDSTLGIQSSFIPKYSSGDYYKGEFFGGHIAKEDFYLFDLENSLKKINTGNNVISDIYISNKKTQSDKSNFFDISICDSGQIIATNQIMSSIYSELLKTDMVIGRLIEGNGKILNHFIIPHNEIDSLTWAQFIDYPFCTAYKDNVYISFVFSKKIYRFNIDGNFERSFHPNEPSHQNYRGKNQLNRIQIRDSCIYSIFNDDLNTKPKLIKYNLNFEKKEERELDISPNNNLGYKIYVTKDRILVHGKELYIWK